MGRRSARRRPAAAAVLLALAIVTGGPGLAELAGSPASLAPLAAPVALAADDGFDIRTSARYTVVPDKGVVRVRVDVRATNRTPNATSGGVVTRYFFDGVNLGLQPEAVRVRASQDGASVPVDVANRDGFRLVKVSFRSSIFFGQTAVVRVTFDLPSGKPRSDSDVRVGAAFATFVAWAFGDRGDVRVELPPGFDVTASGEPMAQSQGDDGGAVLTASPEDAADWYAWVNARNDADLAREDLVLEGGEEIVVRGWPEDERWRTRVAGLLADGVPAMVALIGLPWPVSGPLEVIEVHTPLLEGYAGFYDAATDEITISEDLDNLTIIHEASHAWFNRDLFLERWITEGLADEYAARTLGALGRHVPDPDPVRRDAKAAFALNAWPPPAAIEDEDAAARERYGYDASWSVLRQVVNLVGEDGMRRVLAAAAEETTAYAGDGAPEAAALPNDWRRFLDLAEELGGEEGIDDLVREWALVPEEAGLLDARDAVRDAYHALLDDGDGWAAPLAVRTALDRWAFPEARARIGEAAAVLETRDATAELAAEHALDPPDGLERLYEEASSEQALANAAALAADERAALAEVVEAGEAAAEPRDWLVDLGLDGRAPDADLAAARELWEDGDLDAATGKADAVVEALAAAPELGRRKALVVGLAAAAGLLLLGLLAFLLVRRRRRARVRPAAPGLFAAPDIYAGDLPPEAPDRYATLAPQAAPDDHVEAGPRIDE